MERCMALWEILCLELQWREKRVLERWRCVLFWRSPFPCRRLPTSVRWKTWLAVLRYRMWAPACSSAGACYGWGIWVNLLDGPYGIVNGKIAILLFSCELDGGPCDLSRVDNKASDVIFIIPIERYRARRFLSLVVFRRRVLFFAFGGGRRVCGCVFFVLGRGFYGLRTSEKA